MTEPIIYIDRSTVRPGKQQQLKQNIEELVTFIEEREPQLISYGFYLNEDETEMGVVAVHPDTESLELHMEVGREGFRKFADLIDLYAIEVYGQPGERAMEQIHAKAAMLGEQGKVSVQGLRKGFTRLGVPATTQAEG